MSRGLTALDERSSARRGSQKAFESDRSSVGKMVSPIVPGWLEGVFPLTIVQTSGVAVRRMLDFTKSEIAMFRHEV